MASGAEIINQLWDAVNKEGVAAMRRFHTPDYVRHGSDGDYNLDEWIAMMQEREKAFPDNFSNVVETLSEGNRVAYRWFAEGTHQETYFGIPATGKHVKAEGITISRIENGLICEEWASWNKSVVLSRLGVVPLT